MIALVIQNDPFRAAATTTGLMKSGFQVMTVESLHAAEAMAQIGVIDLLVAEERVKGDLTHRLILSAERRNPGVSAILLTEKVGEDADELYLLMPALYAMLPVDSDAPVVAKFVRAAMSYAGDHLHRTLARDDDAVIMPAIDELPPIAPVEGRTPVIHTAPMSQIEDLSPQPAPAAPFQSIRTPVMH